MKISKYVKNIFFACAALALIMLVYPSPEEVHFRFEEGKPWKYSNLIAPCNIPIMQDSATIQARMDSLEHAFVPVFYKTPGVTDATVIQTLRLAAASHIAPDSMQAVREARMLKAVEQFIKDAPFYKPGHLVVAEDFGVRIADNDLQELRVKETQNASSFRRTSPNGVMYPSAIVASIKSTLPQDGLDVWLDRIGYTDVFVPNLVYDEALSSQLFQAEASHINGALGMIQQGQTVIEGGHLISHQDYLNIRTYEEYVNRLGIQGQSRTLIFLGHLVYVSVLLFVLMLYIRVSRREVWDRPRWMLFILASITLFFALGVCLEGFLDNGIYLVPYAVVPILLVVFFNHQLALFVSLILNLLCAPCATFPLEFVILQFGASVAAVYSLRELSRRTQLMRTAFFVLGAYLVLYLAIGMMVDGSFDGFSLRTAAYLTVSAVLCSVAYIMMAAVERLFGFVSVVTLVELCDVNHPLLRKLSQECPGTFQHSMAVGTLATDAAIRIGANEQLVRAGALYHDIGKLSNPNFFTENQRGVNPHDALSPDQSARIIIQHVTDGLARAERAGLPEVIKNFIREHHGAGKAKYFYFTYCKAHPGEEVDPAPFTYPGPNPRSRETSVLMMADAVEAASRSLREHTPEAIADLVNKIIDGQVADGLHNDSALSFRDVKIIKDEFVKRLMTMYHSRISYPDDPNKKKA